MGNNNKKKKTNNLAFCKDYFTLVPLPFLLRIFQSHGRRSETAKRRRRSKGGKAMSCSSSSSSSEDEGADAYRKGGYHAVRPGDQFAAGRYVAQRKLGWGQFSTVWLAFDTHSSVRSDSPAPILIRFVLMIVFLYGCWFGSYVFFLLSCLGVEMIDTLIFEKCDPFCYVFDYMLVWC